MISCFIEGDALLPLYRIKRKSILELKIYVVIGGFSLLADALLQGSSVLAETFSRTFDQVKLNVRPSSFVRRVASRHRIEHCR